METEGSGLGIFISKNIIEAHGGRMWFESEEQKGTTFYFSLPIKKEFEEFLKEF
jgi:signal transduction histidine kinase